ncbi:MAG: cyclase family protein [Patescibacteria group bacterium]
MSPETHEMIDLTHEIHEGMLTFGSSWHPTVSIERMGTHGKEGRETRKVTFGSHSGTHVDAPLHFIPGGKAIHELPLERLFGPVTILDFTGLGENASVTAGMLKGSLTTRKVLLKYGWGKHWGSPRFYQGYPYLEEEAARYLIDQGIELVAMDTPSPDDSRIVLRGENLGSPKDSPIHKLLLGAGVVMVEYVANLEDVTRLEGWSIAAVPLKIRGADGSPARVFLFS